MKLNSSGKLARFYMWLPPEDKELPQDLCTYFWGLVGRVFFTFGMGGAVLGCFIYVLITAVIFVAQLVWTHKILALYILAVVVVVVVGIWLSERKKKIKIEALEEARLIIGGKVDAIKHRYCPRIEWK